MTDPSSNLAGWLWDHVMTYFTPLAAAIAGSAVTHWFGRRKSKAEHDQAVADRHEQESIEFEESLASIADINVRMAFEWLQCELALCREALHLTVPRRHCSPFRAAWPLGAWIVARCSLPPCS